MPTRIIPALALIVATPVLAAQPLPAATEQTPSADLVESRLRGCLLAGSSATDQPDLRTAVVQVRSFCGSQIARVRDRRIADATRGLSGAQAEAAANRTILALNDEIARAIASITGLKL
ncbi:hypothetical protein ACFFF7_10570 [Novosphingobium aquiterrae]|uniref:UrcA family protein n=1 Tax=Novosphingobium aquiterrae TaxID=624388 RepID=A0ABV6PLG4_9SPHN